MFVVLPDLKDCWTHARWIHTSPQEGVRGVVRPSANDTQDTPDPGTGAVNIYEADFGHLNATGKEGFLAMLCKYCDQGIFPVDPDRVSPCAREELRILMLEETF